MGGIVIIQNQESSSSVTKSKTEKDSGSLIRKTQRKQNKNILKNHTKLNAIDSRKNYSEKPKTQMKIYRNSEGDSVFFNFIGGKTFLLSFLQILILILKKISMVITIN